MPDESVQAIATTPTPEDLQVPDPPPVDEELVVEDLLIEDVSIDGMCGVY